MDDDVEYKRLRSELHEAMQRHQQYLLNALSELRESAADVRELLDQLPLVRS